ncbi:UDP-N-acetylmuramoyl-L-alanyl-D-glutamate--2,6-diaminopimelate ligase [Patescibacteria group bacterium]|nr:UDP-N-acetylmuramoyl-L-alanyl-D-glutamate--2,6-diaminopimelate ligase [Patescibacteria group bacterium]
MESVLSFFRRIIPEPVLDFFRVPYHYTLAVLAAVVYGFPGKKLNVIGVTGTNGKSTTANLLAAILEADGKKVGLSTTVNFWTGSKKALNHTKMTSLGRFQMQRLLREMVKGGCTHAVIEVSSHAIHWNRVWGIPFETAVFTNFSRDHLDLHGTMDEYKQTKGRLFQSLRASEDGKTISVVNGDDVAAPYFIEFFADTKYLYGTSDAAADIMPLAHTVIAKSIRPDTSGTRFSVHAEDIRIPIHLKLPGRFNVSNALAAISVGLAYDVKPKTIAAAIDAVDGVPGRMEPVDAGQSFSIVVDYAHTPDAFDNVLSALREATKGKLITVFGATGDRDPGKRFDLGKIAATYSDFMVLTEEDPGSEDPLDIIEAIKPGIDKVKRNVTYEVEPNRRTAIRMALAKAKRGDTVILLAKGHETVMTYADGKHPWDDRKVAAEEWRKVASKK